MKKSLLLLISGLFLVLTGFSQNSLRVYGTVMDIQSSVPVPQHTVNILIDSIQNSGFVYFNSVITDSNGYYADTIAIPPDVTEGIVLTYSQDICSGMLITQTGAFSLNMLDVELNFEFCTVPVNCEANFLAFPSDSLTLSYQFLDSSTGNPDSWFWDFGDGSTSTEQNPLHTFPSEGTYQVCLTISDSTQTCLDTYCEDITVITQPGFGCESFFTFFSNDSTTFTFEGFGVDPSQQIVSYEWDFGDGSFGSGQTVTHTFAPNGCHTYMVCLTTMSVDSINDTCYYQSCQGIDLGGYIDIQADFTWSPGADSLTIEFQDASIGNPSSWFWVFGDSITSTEQNPVHVYSQPGIYLVCLTVTDDSTYCMDMICKQVSVGMPTGCANSFTYSQDDSLTMTFIGNAFPFGPNQYSVLSFDWDFGDGTTGNGMITSHTFPSANSTYTVCLTTTYADSTGGSCTATSCKEVTLGWMSFEVSGTVYLENQTTADAGMVHLITFDTIGMNLIDISTTAINPDGTYLFENVFPNVYFLQAELDSSSNYFGQYVPTYFISALHWQEAHIVIPSPQFEHDIFMLAGTTTTSGNGQITGNVQNEDNRGNVSEAEILLMDTDHSPLTYLRTNEEGYFDFSGLAYGTYLVYLEMPGIEAQPFMIILDENNPSIELTIVIKDGEALLGIGENPGSTEVISKLYPNPAKEAVNIDLNINLEGKYNLILSNQLGQRVYERVLYLNYGANTITVPVSSLGAGIYNVLILSNDKDILSKKLLVR